MGPLHTVCGKTGNYEKMISSPFITDPDRLPKAADLDRTTGRMGHWLKTAERLDDRERPTLAQEWADDQAGRKFLYALLWNSPFLGNVLVAKMTFTRKFLENGLDKAFANLLSNLAERLEEETDEGTVMGGLRQAKRRTVLLAVASDITGLRIL
jgi:glutamine synthetase adenylyltransferase